MAVRTSRIVGWRRAATGAAATGALAAGLLIGAGTAHADVLDDIYAEYDTGSGGGQVSNLIHTAVKLRSAGFVPSKGDVTDLQAAMDKRPNQVPLIDALQSTIAYQKRSQARRAAQPAPALNPPMIMGGPGGNMPGFGINPNQDGTIQIPIGP